MDPEPKRRGSKAKATTTRREGGGSWLSKIIRAGIAVADGEGPDWVEIERSSRRPLERAELRELQHIEKIAQHCRAAQAEAGASPLDLDAHVTSSLPDILAVIQPPSFPKFAPDKLIADRYRVKALLGRGGMGAVYEAWDGELSIPVALKTLRLEPGRERDALRNLKQEAMLARAVVHPNICRVYDLASHVGGNEPVWFITMEVLRGETLAERLRRHGRFAPHEALPLVAQMAAGLDAAHQSGVVHLDFKSSNVMLVGDAGKEQVVITDFGLARAPRPPGEDGQASIPRTRMIVGTAAYISPEQVRGEAPGPAADIYALGVVLYEMVTGTLPFGGGTALQVANRRLKEAAPSPRTIVPEIDKRWEAVIRRCLEREPERRFERAEDVTAALAGRLSAEPSGAARPESSLKHTLPQERDRFIGRDLELEALHQAIGGGGRLVTLLGAGGMGKTRLAVRYGWQRFQEWHGGVWFCDLTEARDVNGIASAVGKSLGVLMGKADPVEQLGDAIAAREKCLVILDNSEQVVHEVAPAVRRWSERAPAAAFIVTSRERLGLSHESVLDVGPMGMESGIELFVERAKRLRPGLQLSEADLAAVHEVVRLVEGIPLAIELAAARMRVMDAAHLVAGMRKRFSLLTGGPSERHQTLAAAIDASWELLKPWEKATLAQVSVFEGGFTLEAVESVLDLSAYSDAPWPVDVIQSLTDKSLLKTWVPERGTSTWLPEPRFGMYVSIQEYARAKFTEDGAVPRGGSGAQSVRAAEERHGRWFGRRGTKPAIGALDQPGGVERRRALGHELENLIATCRRAALLGDRETATAAYCAVWAVISLRGPCEVALNLGNQVIAAFGPDDRAREDRARALMTLGLAERASGRIEEACEHFEAALALQPQEGTWDIKGALHGNLAGLHCDQGHDEVARKHFDAALTISREMGDRRLEGVVLANLGNLHRLQGRMEEARRSYEAALVIHREVGNRRSEGIALGNLGYMHYEQGRGDIARKHFDAALAIHREVGERRWEGVVLGDLGNLILDQGWMEEARRHYEEALVIDREVGNRRTEGIVLGCLGNLCRTQGSMDEARGYYDAALTFLREVGERRCEGIVLGDLGILDHEEGREEEARGRYETALALHREAGNRRSEGQVLCSLGDLHRAQGRMDEARLNYEAALTIVRETGDRRLEGVVLGKLAGMHFELGSADEARQALAQGEELLRTVQAGVDLAKLLCVRVEVEHRSGQPELAGTVLREVEALATQFGLRPGSELGRMLGNIRSLDQVG